MGKQNAVKSDEMRRLKLLADDLGEKWKRALADYQNLEKRKKEEQEALIKSASRVLIVRLLPALDNLERAAEHLNDEGLKLALRQLWEILGKEGLVKIQTVGQVFNPQEMEAVDVVSGEEEGKVKDEMRPGYKLNGKVIRFAQVRVIQKTIGKGTIKTV